MNGRWMEEGYGEVPIDPGVADTVGELLFLSPEDGFWEIRLVKEGQSVLTSL